MRAHLELVCSSFLRAKATSEVCVCTTGNRGGKVAARGPTDQKPSMVHPAGGEREAAAQCCSGDGEERLGRRQVFEEYASHVYKV